MAASSRLAQAVHSRWLGKAFPCRYFYLEIREKDPGSYCSDSARLTEPGSGSLLKLHTLSGGIEEILSWAPARTGNSSPSVPIVVSIQRITSQLTPMQGVTLTMSTSVRLVASGTRGAGIR